MFTIDQIKAAHAKVKSGADFPQYVQDLIALGVEKYDTFVFDGHSEFSGSSQSVATPAKYVGLEVSATGNKKKFTERLKIHQQGQTDYMTFCRDAAENGVEKWTVDTVEMTCTYYDVAGNVMLTERIPGQAR